MDLVSQWMTSSSGVCNLSLIHGIKAANTQRGSRKHNGQREKTDFKSIAQIYTETKNKFSSYFRRNCVRLREPRDPVFPVSTLDFRYVFSLETRKRRRETRYFHLFMWRREARVQPPTSPSYEVVQQTTRLRSYFNRVWLRLNHTSATVVMWSMTSPDSTSKLIKITAHQVGC